MYFFFFNHLRSSHYPLSSIINFIEFSKKQIWQNILFYFDESPWSSITMVWYLFLWFMFILVQSPQVFCFVFLNSQILVVPFPSMMSDAETMVAEMKSFPVTHIGFWKDKYSWAKQFRLWKLIDFSTWFKVLNELALTHLTLDWSREGDFYSIGKKQTLSQIPKLLNLQELKIGEGDVELDTVIKSCPMTLTNLTLKHCSNNTPDQVVDVSSLLYLQKLCVWLVFLCFDSLAFGD